MRFLNKIRVVSVLFALALLVPFQSCTDLEPEVFSSLTPANFPSTNSDINQLYLSVYTDLFGMQNHGGYMSIMEISSDEAMIPQRGSDWFDGGIWLRTHRQTFDPQDGQYNGAWIFLYRGALKANLVIDAISNSSLSDADKAPFIAEMRSIRAYFYYQLTDAFGDVPLITEESDVSDTEPTATPRAEIFNFVINELEAAKGDLSRAAGQESYGKINFWVNRALASRFLLNAEVMTGSARWADAEAAADEVINGNSPYSLTDDYFTNFDPDNDNGYAGTSENMWVIPYDSPANAGGFNIPQMTLHYSSQATFNLQDQPWNGYCTLQEFYESYDDSDKRKGVYGNQMIRGNFLAGPQFATDGVTPIVDGSADDPGGIELVFTPEVNALEPNAYREAGARIWKFGFENGSPNTIRNDFPIIRYAEVLMNKAEAMKRQNKAGSSMFVNMIRSRAGLDDVDDGMSMDDFLAERGREFFFEVTRRQDLIRFGKFTDPWFAKGGTPETAKLFPIPAPQLNANRNLQQNPGY